MKDVLHLFTLMLRKDLKREIRSKEIFLSAFLFSVILLCVIYFATAGTGVSPSKLTAAGLWLCILFSGTIGLNRTHQSEMANGCIRALILAPHDAGWLYLAKFITNFVLLLVMTVLLLPLLALFFHTAIGTHLPQLLLSLILGVSAFVALGTLVVVITANTRIKDVLFPIIQLPLVIPLLMGAVEATQAALNGEFASGWLQFLGVMAVIFLCLGFILYEFLLEE